MAGEGGGAPAHGGVVELDALDLGGGDVVQILHLHFQ